VPRLLASFDVFALTSLVEANPISILEAMSAGKPVVATDVGSIHEVVTQGTTGFLVPPGDAEQMTERVLQLVRNSRLARSMGAAGRHAVITNWSIDAMVERYENLFESMYMLKRGVASG
jgi:glycosyltransferase involved in cell wall biosynthesis